MKRSMVRISPLAVGLALTVGIVAADKVRADVPLNRHEVAFITNNVPDGVTRTYVNDAKRSERTGVVKMGEGTLSVPASEAGVPGLRVEAQAGKLAFTDDAASDRLAYLRAQDRSNVRVGVYGARFEFLQDAEHIAEFVDCNIDFTLTINYANSDTLDLYGRHGLKTVASGVIGVAAVPAGLSNNEWITTESVKSRLAQRNGYRHGAVKMVSLCDEPCVAAFDKLEIARAAVDETSPEIPAYINLLPSYAPSSRAEDETQLGVDTYQQYIDQYCAKVHTDYISYDFYPYYQNASYTTNTVLPQMYTNYWIVADACRKTGREFWYIAQLNSHRGDTDKLTLNKLRYQAWTSMAFGAQSIAWGCWGPSWWKDNVYSTNGVDAAVGYRDDEQYEKIKAMNAEIKAIGARFMTYTNVATHLVDFPVEYYAATQPSGAFGDVGATDGSPLLVGEMSARDGRGAEALFIVATGDPMDTQKNTHTVRFTASGTVAAYDPDGAIALTNEGDGVYSFTLADNACALVTKDDSAAVGPVGGMLSKAVCDKLALWVSANDARHITIANGNEVEKWYDVRETNTNSPSYVYLSALHTTNHVAVSTVAPIITYAKNVRKYGTETNAMPMVNFRGYGSGASLEFLTPNGASYCGHPYEFSMVYGRENPDKDFGYVIGSCKDWSEQSLWVVNNGLPWMDVWGPSFGDSRTWLDGSIWVRRGGNLPLGVHAVHLRFNSHEEKHTVENALFSARANLSQRGGESLSEVMFFTNVLTSAERVEVQRYLDRKWLKGKTRTSVVTLDSGAELDVAEGSAADVRVTGDGKFVKKGDGTYVYRPNKIAGETPAAITIEGGAVAADRAVSVKLQAGDRITASIGANMTPETLTVGAAEDAASIEKDGVGTATIATIPAGTRKVQVTEGTLALRPVAPPVSRYEVAIPNGDFSYWGGDTTHGNVYPTWLGWSSGGAAGFYHYDRWQTKGGLPFGSSVLYGAFGFAFGEPPEGRCCLMLKVVGAWAGVSMTFPEAGEYEISYLLTARNSDSASYGRIKTYLVDASKNQTIIGYGKAGSSANWNSQIAHRFSVPAAGTYSLCFAIMSPWASYSSADLALIINSLHLYRVGETAVSYKIPNGDFENIPYNGCDYFYGNVTVDGWTFDTEKVGDFAKSGVVFPGTYCEAYRRWGSGHNESRAPLGGVRQVLIRRNGGFVKATFTPPKGKWYLKAQTAMWGGHTLANNGPALIAGIEGGASLGTVMMPKCWTMMPTVWPIPFEADGATQVTIVVTYRGGDGLFGANLDDFELVGAYECEHELIKNGDFELPYTVNKGGVGTRNDWSHYATKYFVITNKQTSAGKYAIGGDTCAREYGRNDMDAFGTDHGSGDYFVEPYNSCTEGGFYQDIAFPHAGWYRLSYLAKTRLGTSMNPDICEVSIVDTSTSTTNIVDDIDALPHGVFTERTALFYVDGAVTRRLMFICRKNNVCYPSFDDVSVRFVGETISDEFYAPDPQEDGLVVNVCKGALLKLEFSGSVAVSRFLASGLKYATGEVSAANCPQIVGPGKLVVTPRNIGMPIIVR